MMPEEVKEKVERPQEKPIRFRDEVGRLEDIEPRILRVLQICHAPSISLGVMHQGQVIYDLSIGYRDVEARVEADINTSYLIGSCSKLLTSSGIGILVDSKALSWEDTIQKHIPEFDPVEDPEIGANATIIDACRHSTGLANPNAVFKGPDGTITVKGEDHIKMMNALPTSNSSGQRFRKWWCYSNAAFGMLANVIEVASEKEFPAFMRDRICLPLGMTQTLFTEASVETNNNVAHPYAPMTGGGWKKIKNNVTSEKHCPTLASMGMRSSVNDLLKFCKAIMDRNAAEQVQEEEEESNSISPNVGIFKTIFNGVCAYFGGKSGNGNKVDNNFDAHNPLRSITPMWNWWWTRPYNDGFENDTVYALGWARTTMPTSALGMLSMNGVRRHEYIIGQDSPPRVVYGHNGCTDGSVATVYLLPETRSAVVALSNAADAGDAAETASQMALQALFGLTPKIDLIPSLEASRDASRKEQSDVFEEWEKNRDVSQFKATNEELLGTYHGLGASCIRIESSDSSSGLAVVFADQEASRCELEPYASDALSFLPKDHDETLSRGMIDWDYWTVGIFRFVRENEKEQTGNIIGFRWKWDEWDYPGLWVKQTENMTSEEYDAVIEKHGRFQKDQ